MIKVKVVYPTGRTYYYSAERVIQLDDHIEVYCNDRGVEYSHAFPVVQYIEIDGDRIYDKEEK